MNVITTRVTPLGASLLATALFTSVISAQNVGIGTTTPKSKLSVNGTTASGGMDIAGGKVAAKGGNLFEIRLDAAHKLKSVSDGDRIFVYGHRVDDLRTVDYDALSMLNISATQELARKVAALEAENTKLKTENAGLAAMASDVKALKEAVAAMQAKDNGNVQTVSLVK